MVSKLSKEHDRRSGLSHYLYGVSTLFLSGVGIGGLSPLVTNQELNIYNLLCLFIGTLSAIIIAYCANRIMKYNDKQYYYGWINVYFFAGANY